MHVKKVLAVLAVAGLASSAMAQSFTAQVGFRADHNASAVPTGNEITVAPGATVNLQILFGAFNAQGFTNRGMFNFIGNAALADPAGSGSLAYRTGVAGSGLRAPYNFGSVENIAGPVLTFDANRGSGQVNGLVWNFGEPAPSETYTYPPFTASPANGGGPNAYFPGERVVVNTGPNTAIRDIIVTVTGPMQAIMGWFPVGNTPPEDPETPGSQDLLPQGFVTAQASATFVIHVVPAPGAAALLGLGGLVAARRRR
jgi:hypothetical protein